MSSELTKEIKEKIEPIIKEKGYEIYDLEYRKEGGGWVMRFYVDNATRSISLDQCAEVSRAIDSILDESFPNLPSYMLEVSSPGLDRLLRNDGDFNWAMGKTLKVKFLNEENKKQVIEGKLLTINPETIELQISKRSNLAIKKSNIEEARRVMKFSEIMPKNAEVKDLGDDETSN